MPGSEFYHFAPPNIFRSCILPQRFLHRRSYVPENPPLTEGAVPEQLSDLREVGVLVLGLRAGQELVHSDIQCPRDAEQGVQADPFLSPLHMADVGDGEVCRLRQLRPGHLPPEPGRSDLPPDLLIIHFSPPVPASVIVPSNLSQDRGGVNLTFFHISEGEHPKS